MSQNQENTGARGPRQIQSDLERNRSRMDDTLDRLQAKFSPDELIDQAKRYARQRSSDGSSSNLQEMVVRNPLPVALIGVGMAWLLLAGRNGSVPHEQASAHDGNDRRSALDNSNTPDTRSQATVRHDTAAGSPAVGRSSDAAARRSSGTGDGQQSTRATTDDARGSTLTGAGASDRVKQTAAGDSDKSRGPIRGKVFDSGRGSQPGSEPGQESGHKPGRAPGRERAGASVRSNKPTPR